MPHHTSQPRRDRDFEAEQRRAQFVSTWPIQTAPAASVKPQHRECSACRLQYVDTLGDVPVMTCDRRGMTCEAARGRRGMCGPAGNLWTGQ